MDAYEACLGSDKHAIRGATFVRAREKVKHSRVV